MPVYLFSSDRPDFYLRSQLFHPVDNPAGQIIPRPHSLVLDLDTGLGNPPTLWEVLTVVEDTGVYTLGPVGTTLLAPTTQLPNDGDESPCSLIDYGNCRFYLYYDESESPTKLNVDKKVIILGNDAKDYELMKYDVESDNYLPISLNYDTNGIFRGNRVPLESIVGSPNTKVATNCHTSIEMEDEDVYYMFIYDYSGSQCGSIKLYAKRAVVNNVLDDTEIIEDFQLEGTQKNALGFYIFPDQDPDSLVIDPQVTYNNGKVTSIPIDGSVCHLYGFEGFTAAYPGQQVDILVKYFLSPMQQAAGDFLDVVNDARFLFKQEKVIVMATDETEFKIKILTVPRYVPALGAWTLMFYLYEIGSDTVRNITHLVSTDIPFNGVDMNANQAMILSFRLREVFPAANQDIQYQQPLVIRLAPFSFYERYTTRDSIGDEWGVFGVDAPTVPRPVIYFDPTAEQYYIPTSKFMNVDIFLTAAYYKARPLFDTSWQVEPIEPTHFTIRDASTGMLVLASPIEMVNYAQAWSVLGPLSNVLVGTNCIIEFLAELQSGAMATLYGAPIDVYTEP